MKVNMMMGDHPKFQKRAQQIHDLYNAEHSWKEEFHANKPEAMGIVYIKGHPGGVLFDRSFYEYPNIIMINMAAFAPQDRGQGFLRACMHILDEQAEHDGHEVAGVYLNPQDPMPVWGRFGFREEATLNLTQCVLRRPMEEIFTHSQVNKGGIPIDEDFFRLLEQHGRG